MTYSSAELKQKYARLLSRKELFFTKEYYSINDFAMDLGTNRSYASRFVNTELGVTFPTLIKKLRLAHFLKLRKESPEQTITALLKQCGFCNAFTFRRQFKAEYGMTPSEMCKENKYGD